MTRRSLFGIAYSVHNRSRSLVLRRKAGMAVLVEAQKGRQNIQMKHIHFCGDPLCSHFSPASSSPKADDGSVRAVIIPGFGMCSLMSTIAPLTDDERNVRARGGGLFATHTSSFALCVADRMCSAFTQAAAACGKSIKL